MSMSSSYCQVLANMFSSAYTNCIDMNMYIWEQLQNKNFVL